MAHFFYLARCKDQSLYAGYCTDTKEREKAHNSGKGAKYTRSRLPVRFVHIEEFSSKSDAMKREASVKKMRKVAKEKLIRAHSTQRRRLFK